MRKFYYILKPYLPRILQLSIRRQFVLGKRKKYKAIWPIDENAGKSLDAWPGWPEGKKFAFILTHDVDTLKGHDKCLQLMEFEKEIGFRSSFNFVPKRYKVAPELRQRLALEGFEVGVHGLYHDGKYYDSREIFKERATQINFYLKEWNAVGFRSPSMLHNLEWIHDLEIEYDASTFDTDPFEPQPDGVGTIFPFRVKKDDAQSGYIELPYTLPQDFTLFILMREKNIDIWKRKLDWIAERGGMALLNTHPDYLSFNSSNRGLEEYPAEYYSKFLEYVREHYQDDCWYALPRDVARFWAQF